MTSLETYAMVAPLATLMIGFGIGWYVKGRGLTGVKIDASNAANEAKTVVADIKAAV